MNLLLLLRMDRGESGGECPTRRAKGKEDIIIHFSSIFIFLFDFSDFLKEINPG